ncbi:hypothetical protein CON39_11860 [Bacillus thuringiensis]|uniref:hypothetical protein n=1 Tax=Bacillus thuringiensis TaxID=1428 RepID=UPI000BECE41A|nr:hypothetical protein [Bacillus thuringiensis]PEF30361.1 hypothetical protein CON39_11860 [Bacillus thuringiensis]
MKGVIQLVIEVNYDEMLKAENLEGIHAYTGIQTEEGMMKEHMGALGNKIVAQLEGLPYVKYNVDGQFYPSTPEQPQTEAVEESVEEEEEQPEEKPVLTGDEEIDSMIKEVDNIELKERLDSDIDIISIEKGFIKAIKVNGEFFEYLKGESPSDETPMSYFGFDIRVEGMEEPYEIEYEPYDGTELKTFSYTIEPKKS